MLRGNTVGFARGKARAEAVNTAQKGRTVSLRHRLLPVNNGRDIVAVNIEWLASAIKNEVARISAQHLALRRLLPITNADQPCVA